MNSPKEEKKDLQFLENTLDLLEKNQQIHFLKNRQEELGTFYRGSFTDNTSKIYLFEISIYSYSVELIIKSEEKRKSGCRYWRKRRLSKTVTEKKMLDVFMSLLDEIKTQQKADWRQENKIEDEFLVTIQFTNQHTALPGGEKKLHYLLQEHPELMNVITSEYKKKIVECQ